MADTLEIIDLRAGVEGKEILKGINLKLNTKEIHALMGPNGSGKSTLANVLLGHPAYTVTSGEVFLNGEDMLKLETTERARKGMFLAFQYPVEIPGVTVGKFLRRAVEIVKGRSEPTDVFEFLKSLEETVKFLEIDEKFINRYLNEGFSGGEKKRMEIAQMLMMKPRFAVLDETDSGLDIDALKIVSRGVNRLRSDNFGALIITHYQRILNYIEPDHVHIMYKGKIVTSSNKDLVVSLEEKGYDWIREKYGTEEDKYAEATAGY